MGILAQSTAGEALREARRAYESDQLEQAVPLYEAAATASDTPDADRVEALETLAVIARTQGRFEEAIDWADQTIEAARRSGDALAEGEALNTRGLAAHSLGRMDEAFADVRASMTVHQRAGHTLLETIRLLNLGGLSQLADRHLDARQYYELALTRLDENASESWAAEYRAVVVANLASLYQRIGRYEKALDLYLASAQQAEMTGGKRAQLLANMGALYRRLGDPYKALEVYAEAEALAAQAGDALRSMSVGVNRGIALALDLNRLTEAQKTFEQIRKLAAEKGARREELHATLYLAETRRRLGKLEQARAEFEEALKQARGLGLVEESWKALYGLGRIAETQGDALEAEQLYRRSIEGVESLRSRLEVDALRRGFLADRAHPYQALIALMLNSPRADPACGDADFCSELLGLIAAQRARAARSKPSPSTADAELEALRKELAQAWRERLSAEPRQRGALDLRIERLENDYQRTVGGDSSLPGASLGGLQRGLEPDTALLVLWVGPEMLLRIWITATSSVYEVSSLASEDLRTIASFAEAAANPDSDWTAAASEAGRLLLGEKSHPTLQAASALLVYQDPSIESVPMEALIPSRFSQALLHSASVTYLPFLEVPKRRTPAWTWPWTKTFAAFAYSQLETDDGAEPLQMVDDEAREMASLLPGDGSIFLEAEADRDRLESVLAAPPPILHFASHAVLDEERPELSRLLLAPSDPNAEQPEVVLLSEIERWNLDGVRLAVLSACDTARGRAVAGDGVRSLSGAFLEAGAESVVAGSWRVPDQETAALMAQFYYHLGRGTDRAEALRLAKLSLASAEGSSHPYYWAGFRLTSRTGGPVVRTLPWPTLLLFVAIALGALGWARNRSRRPARLP